MSYKVPDQFAASHLHDPNPAHAVGGDRSDPLWENSAEGKPSLSLLQGLAIRRQVVPDQFRPAVAGDLAQAAPVLRGDHAQVKEGGIATRRVEIVMVQRWSWRRCGDEGECRR